MNILENKMTLRAYVFPKLKTAKDVVRKVSEKPGSRLPLNRFSFHSEGNRVGKSLSSDI